MGDCSRCGGEGCADFFSYADTEVCLCISCSELAGERFGSEEYGGIDWLENLGWLRYSLVACPNPFTVALEKFLAEGNSL